MRIHKELLQKKRTEYVLDGSTIFDKQNKHNSEFNMADLTTRPKGAFSQVASVGPNYKESEAMVWSRNII